MTATHAVVIIAEGAMKAVLEDYDSDAGTVGNLWVLEMVTSAEMNTVTSHETDEQKVPPIFVEVRIQENPVKMKLDTGGIVSVIDEIEFNSHFPDISMEPSDL